MGIRRAAQAVANVLGLRDWLSSDTAKVDNKSHQRNIRGNMFAALENEDENSEESEDSCDEDKDEDSDEDTSTSPRTNGARAGKQDGSKRKKKRRKYRNGRSKR